MAGVQRAIREIAGARFGWATVDNPARLNALDGALCRGLRDAVAALGADPDIRAVVVAGAGDRAFIGGADVREMAGLDPATATAFISLLRGACAAIRAAPVPVVARISGHCLGGGLEIAAACDFRIADESAAFGMPETRLGVPSVIDAALLPDLIGWGRARMMVYTGETVGAREALEWGLVERLAPRGALDAALERALTGIAACEPGAIRAQKALIREWERLPRDRAAEAGIAVFAEAFAGPEPRRRMRAFLDRARREKSARGA